METLDNSDFPEAPPVRFSVYAPHHGNVPLGFFTLAGAEQWIANEIAEKRLKPGQALIFDDSGVRL